MNAFSLDVETWFWHNGTMPTTNTAELTDPSLLYFLREQTRAGIIERREKLGNGTGGLQEREELAVLYGQALTLALDPLTLKTLQEMTADDFASIPEEELREWVRATKSAESLFRWGCRQAGLDV